MLWDPERAVSPLQLWVHPGSYTGWWAKYAVCFSPLMSSYVLSPKCTALYMEDNYELMGSKEA